MADWQLIEIAYNLYKFIVWLGCYIKIAIYRLDYVVFGFSNKFQWQ